MKSMTGYGASEILTEAFQLTVEIKSYNNRYLDIINTLPYYLAPFEMEIKNEVKKVASRGHVEVAIRVKMLKSDVKVVVDKDATSHYAEAFRHIIDASGMMIEPKLSDFLSVDGILSTVSDTNTDKFRMPLFETLSKALKQFADSKDREGLSTQNDLIESEKKIEDSLVKVEARADELEAIVTNNLKSRFEEIVGSQNYDDNRVMQEVASMLVKATINEEIKRLHIHLDEFKKLVKSETAIGKRLDFLCQEMNREINTIGSKSQIAELNLEVVQMKDSLENIREQVRNVE
ncbi:MAG: YicC family protein [Sphaerochaetaceae bacterium]|nr:YicC family protein [Sphaerochaetaceae bacterium]